jgi:outer membrane protein assembly factor BamB
MNLKLLRTSLIGLGLFLLVFSSLTSAMSLWSHKPGSDINWQQLTDLGTLLVGTDDAISCYEAESGKVIWKRDFRKITESQVVEIHSTPLILVSENSGWGQTKTKLTAVNLMDGMTLWETEKLKGATVNVLPVYEKNMVILTTVVAATANKDKPDIIAFDMVDGTILWESELPDKVDLHAIEGAGKYIVKFDLSGHQAPFADADSLYYTCAGVHRFDLATGKLLWGVPYDVTEGKIKKGNAQIAVDGNTVYTSAKGQLRAIDKATGAVKWTSKDFGGAIAEMVVRGNVIYGRLGGNFYDWSKREWQLKKPLGVVTVNKQTGAPIALYDKMKDSVTNMTIIDAQKSLLIADAENLIGLAIDDAGSLREAFKVKLDFKKKIGAMDVAGTALKIGFGGLGALAKKKGPDDGDDHPVAISLRENGTAVVRGKQHLLAFNPASRTIAWSVKYEAPGVPGWQKAVMFGITAFSYAMNTGIAANTYYGSSQNYWANKNRVNVIRDYSAFVSKRYSATQSSGKFVYILTNVQEGKEKGAGLVGVNLDTGETNRQVMLKDKTPDYKVDEILGRVFNIRDGKELVAYPVQ